MQGKKARKHYKLYFAAIIAIIYSGMLLFVAFKYIDTNRYWDIYVYDTDITAVSGQDIHVKARIKNKTYYVLGSKDNYFISYHIYDEIGGTIKYENPRINIENIDPGGSGNIDIQIKAPTVKGRYKIIIDIVKEGEYWFKDRGESPGALYLNVN